MLADLRLALRALVRAPAFTVVAVLTLALGIGATSAMFSVVHGVLLKPLPFAEPERLVSLMHHGQGAGAALMNQGETTWFTYLDQQRAFAALGAWDRKQVSITGRGEPERAEALAARPHAAAARVRPARGRLLTARRGRPGAPLRASDARLLAAPLRRRADVVGQTIAVGDQRAEVVGVLRVVPVPGVSTPRWCCRSSSTAPTAGGISFGFQAIGRLKPGVTLAQANADVARMIALLPPALAVLELAPSVRPLAADVVGQHRRRAVGAARRRRRRAAHRLRQRRQPALVRAEGRQHEFALRAALGASRARVARAVLAEGLLLALAPARSACSSRRAPSRCCAGRRPAQLPRVDEIAIDPTVLLFTLAIATAAGLLAGCVTVARSASRTPPPCARAAAR
jgi:hypothetical protein